MDSDQKEGEALAPPTVTKIRKLPGIAGLVSKITEESNLNLYDDVVTETTHQSYPALTTDDSQKVYFKRRVVKQPPATKIVAKKPIEADTEEAAEFEVTATVSVTQQ